MCWNNDKTLRCCLNDHFYIDININEWNTFSFLKEFLCLSLLTSTLIYIYLNDRLNLTLNDQFKTLFFTLTTEICTKIITTR